MHDHGAKREDSARDRTSAARSTPDASIAGGIIDLQRSAGNRAVGQALAKRSGQAANTTATPAPSKAPPPPSAAPANTSSVAQFGAMWQELVVRPIARAKERILRVTPELEAALSDLDTALAGIASVKNATPASEDNYMRLEIVERRVRGFRDLVLERTSHAKDDHAIERDMIAVRLEATELGKAFDDPTGDVYKNDDPLVWKVYVVDVLWEGQMAFGKGDYQNAFTDFGDAYLNIDKFVDRVAGYHARSIRRLQAALYPIWQLMEDRNEKRMGDAPLFGDIALDHAVTMGKFLTGQPVDEDSVDEAPAPAAEPTFTWEERTAPAKDDTALERP